MLLLLIGCFQIEDKEWEAWSEASSFSLVVDISPAEAHTGTELACGVMAEDVDIDFLLLSYQWFIGGVEVGDSPDYIVSADESSVGDDIDCVVTATNEDGEVVIAKASVTLQNTAPAISDVVVLGDTEYLFFDEQLMCTADITDADEPAENLTVSYEWYHDDTLLWEGESIDLQLPEVAVSPMDELQCMVTVIDSHSGVGEDSLTIRLGNRPPTEPTVSISWEGAGLQPFSSNDLTCLGEGSIDPEYGASEINYSYSWSSDVGGSVEGTVLSSSETVDGETWTCTVTASDGFAEVQVSESTEIFVTLDWANCPAAQNLGDAAFQFLGENEQDYAGYSVSSAGDVDGDGLDDILIGAYGNDDNGGGAGKIYLIFGSSLGTSSVIDLATADHSFMGENGGDDVGYSAASAGDVDGDGLDDILIGSTNHAHDGVGQTGKVYLIFGSSLGGNSAIDLSSADYIFYGENHTDLAGSSVAATGDVDGDGLNDILIGAYGYDSDSETERVGRAYLILASSLGGNTLRNLADSDYLFIGENHWDQAGTSVAFAGDVDGDGKDDILIGAPNNDDGGNQAGKVSVILGSSLGSNAMIDLGNADYSLVGEEGKAAGTKVSSAGDVDGDGFDDILIGAYGGDAGQAYLVLGSSLGSTSIISLADADYTFLGEVSGDRAGESISPAGDIDGDGLDDILIGAVENDENGNRSGKIYLFTGGSLGNISELDLIDADYTFIGEYAGDRAARGLSSAGDINGDGLDDILIGAPNNDDSVDRAGKAVLFTGCE